jgi:hypothetical protein
VTPGSAGARPRPDARCWVLLSSLHQGLLIAPVTLGEQSFELIDCSHALPEFLADDGVPEFRRQARNGYWPQSSRVPSQIDTAVYPVALRWRLLRLELEDPIRTKLYSSCTSTCPSSSRSAEPS